MLSSLEAFFPLKEEDKAVNIGLDFIDKFVIIHTVDLFDLNRRGAYFLDEFCENSRIWLNRTPLIEHLYYNNPKSNLNHELDYKFQ